MPGNHFNHCLKLQPFHHGGDMFFKIKIKFITMPTQRRNSAPVVRSCTFTKIHQQTCRMIIKRAVMLLLNQPSSKFDRQQHRDMQMHIHTRLSFKKLVIHWREK